MYYSEFFVFLCYRDNECDLSLDIQFIDESDSESEGDEVDGEDTGQVSKITTAYKFKIRNMFIFRFSILFLYLYKHKGIYTRHDDNHSLLS